MEGTIFVREYNQTYIARLNGKTASCTASREYAARAVAKKVFKDQPFIIKKCGDNDRTFFAVSEEKEENAAQ